MFLGPMLENCTCMSGKKVYLHFYWAAIENILEGFLFNFVLNLVFLVKDFTVTIWVGIRERETAMWMASILK